MTMQNYDNSPSLLHQALVDFQEAHRKAVLEGILARFSGKQTELLSYDEVRQKLHAIESAGHRLEEIPLDKIVGSVNRYTDFTRPFLPLLESDSDRWARVRAGVEKMSGLPPIEAYKLGDVYFVSDGHHRVSVARELGAKSIEGYVIPVHTRVPLSPGDRPDDLILKSEYADFLAKTRLDDLRPAQNLLVTAPGQYQKLLEHISVHRYFMGEKRRKEVAYDEAVTDWYDTIYQPITELIQEQNLLRDFPGRTETDLYLWIMDHRSALNGGGLGWQVSPERAAKDLAIRYSPTAHRRFPRLVHKILDLLTPDYMAAGPPPGSWRAEHQSPQRFDCVFGDILVAVPGDKGDWPAVRLAFEVARREEARLTGLHVVNAEKDKETDETRRIQAEFERRCAEAGIAGRFVVETGQAASLLCQRSPWVDLVIFRLSFPPPSKPIQRLRSGTRLLIRRCTSPLLAVPQAPIELESILLAYGPGRKSDEALYVATYLAGRWKLPLTVVTVKHDSKQDFPLTTEGMGNNASSPTPLDRAHQYLETHDIEATYIVEESGDPARVVLLNAEARNAGMILMGGYESGPLRESIFGSTVDRVLRSTRRPVLICR